MNNENQKRVTVSGFSGIRSAATDADGYKKPPIIQELTIRPIYRRSQDIEKWRIAMRAAEATVPRRVELYDLYEDILLDAHLRSVVEKRIMAITNTDWIFVDSNGKEIEEANSFIDSPDFDTLITEIMNSKFWGYSMIEFDFHEDGSIGVFNVPRKHIRPELGLITFEQTGDAGIDIRSGMYADTILEAGKEKDLGLLLSAAQYVIYKRGNFGDWAQFSEIFGMPLIDAQWDGFDEKQRILLQEAINNMGGGSSIVRPAGTNLQFIQGSSNNPTGDLYNNFITACNAEISKLILGQTETTESSESSGYAQASVHGQTENDINRADITFVRRILNRRVTTILKANGLFADGSFAVRTSDADTGLTLDQQLNIDLRLLNEAQLPISDDYLYEKYGIEKPTDYDAQKQALRDKASQSQFGLNSSFRNAPQANGAKIISLRDLYADCNCGCQSKKKSIKLADPRPNDDDFIKKVFDGELKDGQIHNQYYFNVAQKLTEAIKKGLSGQLADITHPKTKLFERLRDNVFAFSAAKSLTMLQAFNNQLRDEQGNDRTFTQFRNAVIPVNEEFNNNYLKAEYNSTVGMSQMADKWDSLQQFDYLEYRTAGDNRVRKEHERLDGVVLEKNDPLWDTIYPPNGWNCRCTVIPSNENAPSGRDRAAQVKSSNVIKPYFRRNVGTEKIIFKDDHPYFQRAAHDLKKGKLHQFMAEENYGMPSVESIMKRKLPELKTTATVQEAQEQWGASEKNITTVDGMKWNISDQWEHVTKHNNDNRWQFINNTRDVLENADEVWNHREVDNNTQATNYYKQYVKYYKDAPVVFSYNVNNPNDWTMYKADVDDTGTYSKLRERVRKGVLIYKK